ncbi:hypothetical protein KVR01_005488 [Diaporthe batatas]|uniref:uncharacterized protein n=1 Tax=Diaporthe batatas TaxID=748121 RepID=UPI001D03EB89|nr:uncharacterized protein KVR01_005488 [Diaporthe batatas]KAG8165213.1 hypothetical protein KVR01_005488 [Diaporthe batatas]
MEEEPASALTSEDLHPGYLERSRKELSKKVEQLKRALAEENEKCAAISQKSHGKQRQGKFISTSKQLQQVAVAYRDVAALEPFLPFPDSVVPALVALRTTNSTIVESKKYLALQKLSLKDAQDKLDAEKASLSDQTALTKALERRIQSLRDEVESRTTMSPKQITRERISELKQDIKATDADTSKLLRALKKFIDERLASMIAAEQGGGPVAGDMMEIDSDDLEAGFSARGKRKKSKPDAATDKRQRRIDDMFEVGQDRPGRDEGESDKRVAAREEMQSLTEELMNSVMEADGSSSDAYVSVSEESAAVRLLVRSKVAEFHPRDSKRLRLVDFGREIGD